MLLDRGDLEHHRLHHFVMHRQGKMNMEVALTQEDLDSNLEEQLAFLESSASAFDNGFAGEVKRLAVTVRVLLHDTTKSTSLLTLLGKKGIKFVDTAAPVEEQNHFSHSSLVQLHLGSKGSTPLPLLDEGPFNRKINFDPWWNGIVFVDKDKNEFSRKDIVLTLANKEGGAHVDTALDQKYANLRKNNSLNWFDVSSNGKQTPSADQVPATMRQIAHEVLKTLKAGYHCALKHPLDGVLVMGASLVQGAHAPSVPDHNLPKNRTTVNGKKIGRNDPCPCGSGKKYKHCCIG